MKFWAKIYLFSTLTFFLIFNAASFIVIEQSHNRMLRQEIDMALNQNLNILSTVESIVPVLRIYDSIDYEKTVLTRIAEQFSVLNQQQTYLDIRDGSGRIVYSNIDFDMPEQRGELTDLDSDNIQYILRDIGNRTILFTTHLIKLDHMTYYLTYMKDVTGVYADRIAQYKLFLQVDIAACFIYMLIMYVVSRRLTSSIERLNRSAQSIAQGEFSERAVVKSKDEVGVLARSFNDMAAVVEEKIMELERNNQEKQRFIDNFTHELKTPLTSIIAYANFLRTTKHTEEMLLDGLEVIYSEGKRLEALSLKLMDLITLQEDHFQMELQDLGVIIAEILPALEMKVKDKQLTLITDCELGKIKLEKDLIKVLIFNLVDNAYKASSEQQTITISSQRRGEKLVLAVADQGIGIAEDHRYKIFEPFYMVDKSRMRSSNGAGLGLAICQSVAALHHALIQVSSKEHQGTTVEVLFPLDAERRESK